MQKPEANSHEHPNSHQTLTPQATNGDFWMSNSLTLKWGTVKGWSLESDEAKAALQKWADHGVCMSAAMQKDSPEQQQALLDAIDHMDEIYLDWDGKTVTREEAKEYVLNYGKES